MSATNERDRFLAGDSSSRPFSPAIPLRAISPNSSPYPDARTQAERQIPATGSEYSLATDVASQSNEQEKIGLGVVDPKRRLPCNKIVTMYRSGWTAEICSCMIALISLIALVTTLLVHQDRPLPKWPSFITVNALVSIFTSVFRSGIGMALAEGESSLSPVWILD